MKQYKASTPVRDINFEKLEARFPHIKYKEGEDLNIDKRIEDIFRKVWFDTQRFPTVAAICKATGLNERTVYRYRNNFGFKTRTPEQQVA